MLRQSALCRTGFPKLITYTASYYLEMALFYDLIWIDWWAHKGLLHCPQMIHVGLMVGGEDQ